MNELKIAQVDARHDDLAFLIGKLDEELLQLYPGDEIFGIDVEDPAIDEAVFVIAYVEGVPAGCGGIRPIDDESMELKRFYVDPSLRSRGIAKRMLDELEMKAKEMNFGVIKLETGPQQVAALQFYRKNGYHEIDRFGEYADCPSSLCFEKRL